MNAKHLASLGLLLALLAIPASVAKAQREIDTVARANWVIDEIVAKNRKGLPPTLLRDAYAVAIFPNIIKGGFVIGGRFGNGVVMVRNGEQWSYPIFATLGGGSFGLQAGIQSTDLVLVFKSRQSLDSFFEGRDKLTIAADGSVALGPLGRHAEAGTGVALKAQYVAYSRNRGLFAGASLAGTGLAIDWRANAIFYGRSVTPGDIILKNKISIAEADLPATQTLRDTMMRKTQMGVMPDDSRRVIEMPPIDGSEVIIQHDEPVTLDGRPVQSKPAAPRRRTNPDDEPDSNDDNPELLPAPLGGPAPLNSTKPAAPKASSTSTSTPSTSTTTKPRAARPARPPVDNSDLDFPPLQAPSTTPERPKTDAPKARKPIDAL